MNCHFVSFSNEVQLECCADGITVWFQSRAVSFSPGADPQCQFLSDCQGRQGLHQVHIGLVGVHLPVLGGLHLHPKESPGTKGWGVSRAGLCCC